MINILSHVDLTLDRRPSQHQHWWGMQASQMAANIQVQMQQAALQGGIYVGPQQSIPNNLQAQLQQQQGPYKPPTLKFHNLYMGGVYAGVGGMPGLNNIMSGAGLSFKSKPLWAIDMYGVDMAYTVRLVNA